MKLTRQRLRRLILESLPDSPHLVDPVMLDKIAVLLTTHRDPDTIQHAFELAVGIGHGEPGSFSVTSLANPPIFGMTVSRNLFRAIQKQMTIYYFRDIGINNRGVRMYEISFR